MTAKKIYDDVFGYLAAGIDGTQTTLTIDAAHNGKFKDPVTVGNYYLRIWNITDWAFPAMIPDPDNSHDVETVEVTAQSGNNYTITRGALGSQAGPKNTAGKQYAVAMFLLEDNYNSVIDHVIAAHAPSDAQKNSDITKSEIEDKLVDEITSHTHPAGGDFVKLLEVDETTGVSYIEFTDTLWGSNYKHFILKFENVRFSIDGKRPLLQLSYDGTYSTSAYKSSIIETSSSNYNIYIRNENDTYLQLADLGTDINYGVSGEIQLYGLNTSGVKKNILWNLVVYELDGNTPIYQRGSGTHAVTSVADKFKLYSSSGNILGRITLYGVK